MLFQHLSHLCFELTAIIALEYFKTGERANLVNVGIISTTSFACFGLMGPVTLYLEVTSISERMYLYLFPYNISLGMYNKSN